MGDENIDINAQLLKMKEQSSKARKIAEQSLFKMDKQHYRRNPEMEEIKQITENYLPLKIKKIKKFADDTDLDIYSPIKLPESVDLEEFKKSTAENSILSKIQYAINYGEVLDLNKIIESNNFNMLNWEAKFSIKYIEGLQQSCKLNGKIDFGKIKTFALSKDEGMIHKNLAIYFLITHINCYLHNTNNYDIFMDVTLGNQPFDTMVLNYYLNNIKYNCYNVRNNIKNIGTIFEYYNKKQPNNDLYACINNIIKLSISYDYEEIKNQLIQMFVDNNYFSLLQTEKNKGKIIIEIVKYIMVKMKFNITINLIDIVNWYNDFNIMCFQLYNEQINKIFKNIFITNQLKKQIDELNVNMEKKFTNGSMINIDNILGWGYFTDIGSNNGDFRKLIKYIKSTTSVFYHPNNDYIYFDVLLALGTNINKITEILMQVMIYNLIIYFDSFVFLNTINNRLHDIKIGNKNFVDLAALHYSKYISYNIGDNNEEYDNKNIIALLQYLKDSDKINEIIYTFTYKMATTYYYSSKGKCGYLKNRYEINDDILNLIVKIDNVNIQKLIIGVIKYINIQCEINITQENNIKFNELYNKHKYSNGQFILTERVYGKRIMPQDILQYEFGENIKQVNLKINNPSIIINPQPQQQPIQQQTLQPQQPLPPSLQPQQTTQQPSQQPLQSTLQTTQPLPPPQQTIQPLPPSLQPQQTTQQPSQQPLQSTLQTTQPLPPPQQTIQPLPPSLQPQQTTQQQKINKINNPNNILWLNENENIIIKPIILTHKSHRLSQSILPQINETEPDYIKRITSIPDLAAYNEHLFKFTYANITEISNIKNDIDYKTAIAIISPVYKRKHVILFNIIDDKIERKDVTI